MKDLRSAAILVVGAGTMGAGIAQVAAQAGHRVYLFDVRDGAAADAERKLGQVVDGLVAKSRMSADAGHALLRQIRVIDTLQDAATAGLAIEAVVEQVEAKRTLFAQFEEILAADAIVATNTSSISVTKLANGMRHPGRLVGMHFFNPVPLMKLVEVVSGLHTTPEVAQSVFDLAQAWGKVPVHARSTPGFIVNRIARPFYAETLALLQERVVEPRVVDACLRAAGFRMGACELMDLIGHDTNLAVTKSVYEASFFDKRYVPSLVQQELVDGGLLGRKSGRGFYVYPAVVSHLAIPAIEPLLPSREVIVYGSNAIADAIERAAASVLDRAPQRTRDSDWTGIAIDGCRLVLTDGRTAKKMASVMQTADVAVFDRPLELSFGEKVLAYAVNRRASQHWKAQAPAWLSALGFAPYSIADAPGLVVARTIAMLINEATDAVLQGACTEDGADAAMRLGVNYPAGPFEWLSGWSVEGVIGVIEALDSTYRGERYRVSPWLQSECERA
jgi:3-hydroxybutyryl-CoA dehydrogenase